MAAFFVFIILAGFCLALFSAAIAVIVNKIFSSLNRVATIVISGLLPTAMLFFWLVRMRITVGEQIRKDPQLRFRNHFGVGFLIISGGGYVLVVVSAIFGLIAAFYILNRSK